jgi:probable rRNA maturation factor
VDSHIIFIDNAKKLDSNDLNRFKPWIVSCAKNEGFYVGELSFTFCDDAFLNNINVEYLNHDTFTDIVTFDYGKQNIIAGEIFISVDRVFENASKFNQNFDQEIHRIIIHGVLHLLGYKDKSPEEKKQMSTKEDYYLSLLPDLDK